MFLYFSKYYIVVIIEYNICMIVDNKQYDVWKLCQREGLFVCERGEC